MISLINFLPSSSALGGGMAPDALTLGFLPNIGPVEIGVILIIGLLLFGRKLPEVGRNVGRSIVEFKRGLKDVSSELDAESRREEAAKRADPASLPDRESDSNDGRRVSRADAPDAEPVSTQPPYSSQPPQQSGGESRA